MKLYKIVQLMKYSYIIVGFMTLCMSLSIQLRAQNTLQEEHRAVNGVQKDSLWYDSLSKMYVYRKLDRMPEFNGNLSSWLLDNLKFPNKAIERHEQGMVGVGFIVDEEGKVIYPRVIRSSGYPLLDSGATQLTIRMPRWKPALFNEKPVAFYFTIPLSFKIE